MKDKKIVITIITIIAIVLIGGVLLFFLNHKWNKDNTTNNEVSNQVNNEINNRINVEIGNEEETEKEYVQDDYKNAIIWYYMQLNENNLASAQVEYNKEEDKYIANAYYFTKDGVKGTELYIIDAKTGKGIDSKNNEIDFKSCLDKAYKDRMEKNNLK